ncbi:Holliday junction resolvase RuvX [Polynucleobacter paneuropaeus]|uniref:Putative pre-16S rRNA nuclease n=1 Tax=Polynucleobacter paneuropaeus TaxID=2527775 RepID=A0AAE2YLG4_9BURK|nr:Holliday junction resolvase RuvX [Polynucleobacter paneuropaeus]MBT8523538.1 Holliday junction resolvase RuvX [Polynucleobacter paneuropaeus]MBT8526702.1 Holliday junction resolvase RuvX [Polynucleobacter paneuropaeus]MBT8529248.1 Holliday junction resolvase RuvX [Polynucleobacter paneuropaeus]MBT8533364.1 Holliday junction resolvase RuvX [Polynucleobacter paneuropaeus]MBT8534509.1 Holliday junction resolvase RuvX [Polynucleobacter paneuropaeus]
MPSPLTVMGFDYGTRRIGIAIGNTLSCTAQALEVIARDNEDARFADIESLLKEWMPNLLVVGVPTHPDGAEHEMTAKAKRFGNQLSGRFKLPVEWVDERYSSVVLEGDPEMRDNLDAHSATLLLEQYFAEHSLTGN